MTTSIQPINHYRSAYFLGIGGIGMSAIARYLLSMGLDVYGYDKTPTPLTNELSQEGALIVFNDNENLIPSHLIGNTQVLWIITPAIPTDHRAWNYLKSLNTPIFKRSEVLGSIARNGFCIAVAGTHGKTTTSTLIAHLLYSCNVNFTAFLGGISANYNTNYVRNENGITLEIQGKKREIIVLEADEFDRSFHRLNPDLAVITAMDPDHLDIYGTEEEFTKAFNVFASLIRPQETQHSDSIENNTVSNNNCARGAGLVIHEKLTKEISIPTGIERITYGTETTANSRYQGVNIAHGNYQFEYCSDSVNPVKFECGLPGFHNIENATAAIAITQHFLRLPWKELQEGILTYRGAKRRFETVFKTSEYVVIDDYAHHPEELNAIIRSVKALYPNFTLTGIFQPHLFTRTRDFVDGFAKSLSQLDECWLMDIYPAREKPIPGISSQWLLEKITTPAQIMNGPEILSSLKENPKKLLLILGAGDIDKLVSPIKEIYSAL